MGDIINYLKPIWNEITRQMKVDKVYLETHRDLIIVNQDTLNIAKKFFKDRGIEIAGGITLTISEPNRFQTFCYSDPADRKKVKELSEYTAKNLMNLSWMISFLPIVKTMVLLKTKVIKAGHSIV